MGNREELGRIVAAARLRAGYSDTRAWSEAVGRSSRQLLGLERGEQVGRKTLLLVEAALDWPAGWCERYLAGQESGQPEEPPAEAVTITDDELLMKIEQLRTLADSLEADVRKRGGGGRRDPHNLRR
jgi:hypothetical protein